LLMACLLAATTATAQSTYEDLMKKYKSADNAEYVHVPRLGLKIAAMAASAGAEDEDEKQAARMLRKLNEVRVLNLDDCKAGVARQFLEDFQRVEDGRYELLVKEKEDGEQTTVMVRKAGSRIKGLLVMNAEAGECSLVMLDCDVSEKDLDQLIATARKEN